MAGGQPHYHLHAMDKSFKERDFKARIGAGWLKEDGSISISLNPFVKLEAHPDLVLTLFVNSYANNPPAKGDALEKAWQPQPQPKGELPDDDIPF